MHNLISLEGDDGKLAMSIIDTPAFQRLRRIRQLGFSSYVFPGAEHSRFCHSIGAFHVAGRMLHAVTQNSDRDLSGLNAIEELKHRRREILAAALLHDIGHGPFSHVFERALPEGAKRHEEWSQSIIREGFEKKLREHNIKSVDSVTNRIAKKRDFPLGNDFVSSQLDADRMDFLLRDSHHTGVNYGQYDIEWLLNSLRIGRTPAREPAARLCPHNPKGVHVVEQYLMARESMYLQVYAHKTTRAYEALFINILRLAIALSQHDEFRTPKPCTPEFAKLLAGKELSIEDYLELDDFSVLEMIKGWAKGIPKNDPDVDTKERKLLQRLSRKLVLRDKPLRCVDIAKDPSGKLKEQIVQILTRCESDPVSFSLYYDRFEDDAYKGYHHRQHKEEEDRYFKSIYLVDESGKPELIEENSQYVKAFGEITNVLARVYYDDDEASAKNIGEKIRKVIQTS